MASAGSGGAARRRAVAPGLHALVMGGGAWPLVRAPRVSRRQRAQSRRDDRAVSALSRALRRQSRAAARLRRQPRHLRQGRHETGAAGLRAPLRGRPRAGRARAARRQREHPRRHDRVAHRGRLPHLRSRRRASGRHRSVHRAHLVRRTQLRRLQDRAPGAARQVGPLGRLPAGRDDRPAARARVRPRGGGRRPGRSGAAWGPARSAPSRTPPPRRCASCAAPTGPSAGGCACGAAAETAARRRRPRSPPATSAPTPLKLATDDGSSRGAFRAADRRPPQTAGCNRGCTCARCA